MQNSSSSLKVYNNSIDLISNGDYKASIIYIKENINIFKSLEEISLAYINCGFINYKLKDYHSAIEDFTKAIIYEDKADFFIERSKDISYNARSNSKYSIGFYKGAIDDKRKAKKIRLVEYNSLLGLDRSMIDYKKILLGSVCSNYCKPEYKFLSDISTVRKSKYDLIDDYKKVLDNQKKDKVINKLEVLSDEKYKVGDYKGSINALRRADKYYY